MKGIFVILLTGIAVSASSTDIKTSLFYGKNIESVVVSFTQGSYTITGNEKVIARSNRNRILHIDLSDSSLIVNDENGSYGPFYKVSFIPEDSNCVFMVRPVFRALLPVESDDRLDITSANGFLMLINTIGLEKYISGIVEAEGGPSALPEFYKAQAVLARTYAVRNYYRHAHQGFNLCDGVHCQAFNGKSRMNKDIYIAVEETESQILTDKSGVPVMTAYHSSCGGMTASAAIEWNRELDYLVPIADPFCNRSKNRNWSKNIPIQEWNAYLEKTGNKENQDFAGGEKGRIKYLDITTKSILLTDIRMQFNLKSSWFHIENNGTYVTIKGHGYGHGLGLCQEGAMEMARVGYNYVDILMFYFRGVELVNRD
jgi:stage II sporulation protein D